MNDYLFVYGTLKANERNHKFLTDKFKSVQKAYTYGKMFHLFNENYPALIEGEDTIYGEVYEIEDFSNRIKEIDKLENFLSSDNINSEYIRSEISIFFEDGKEIIANTYLYNQKNSLKENSCYLSQGSWTEKYWK